MSSKVGGAVAQRYSAALFELAEEKSALDAVAADLKSLKAMIVDSADLRGVLDNPVVSRAAAAAALTALAEQSGFNQLTGNFLGLLAANRRLTGLKGVIDAFLERLAAKRGEVTAHVASAQALDAAQTEALSARLKTMTGRTVALDAAVDPSLIGGLVVRVGSRMIDSSLKTKLQQLALALKGDE